MEDKTDQEYRGKQRKINRIGLIALFGTVSLWYCSKTITAFLFGTNGATYNQFDSVASLFSALSVGGVIYAIFLQRLELEMQRHEIKQSTKALQDQKTQLESQAIALKDQNETLKNQRFDDTFFNLLTTYSRLDKAKFDFIRSACLNIESMKVCKNVPALMQAYNIADSIQDQSTDKEIFKVSLMQITHDAIIAHIRTFEIIVDYIYERRGTNIEARDRYLNMFFSQLTNFELMAYFYHFNLRRGFDEPTGFKDYKDELFKPLSSSSIMILHHYQLIANMKK